MVKPNGGPNPFHTAATCMVCGEPGKPFIQSLYGHEERVVLCPDHVKSRKFLGYALRSTSR